MNAFSFDFIKSEIPYYQEVILYYKITPCPSIFQKQQNGFNSQMKPCLQGSCFNFHNLDERRRPTFSEGNHEKLYNPFICPAMQTQGVCQEGDNCRFCHTANELDYHPAIYKTEACKGCLFDSNPRLCSRFHSDEVSRKVSHEKFLTRKPKDQ